MARNADQKNSFKNIQVFLLNNQIVRGLFTCWRWSLPGKILPGSYFICHLSQRGFRNVDHKAV